MNGHIIDGTPIAVDFWKVRECPQVKLFFLSHVHDDHIKGLTPSWRLPIYTSPISAKLLAHIVKVPAQLIKVLEVGTSHLIPLGEKGDESMTVTLIDARHCPGSVMFLFEGYFGTFLYTGDFRYDCAMVEDPAFSTLPPVDRLYLDNTYCSPGCTQPNRELVTEKILEVIRTHPPNTRVLIGLTRVGKEDLLVKIAKDLKEWIVVDRETYVKMQILEMSDVFTVDDITSRIQVLPFHVLNRHNFEYQDKGNDPFIIILPSSILGCNFKPPYGSKKNIYAMPYSNHSSFSELTAFVSKVRPRKIVPIVNGKDAHSSFSAFDSLLDPTPCKHFQMPLCLENWHVLGRGPKPSVVAKRKRKGVSSMTKGVSFIAEDSSGSSQSGKSEGDEKQVNGSQNPHPLELKKQATRTSISDSDCDSDSGIFAALKKLKPQAECADEIFGNGVEISDPLSSVADPKYAELQSGDQVTEKTDQVDLKKVDKVDLNGDVDLVLLDAIDFSALTENKTMGCQDSSAEEPSQKGSDVALTLVSNGETLSTKSNSPALLEASTENAVKDAPKDVNEVDLNVSSSPNKSGLMSLHGACSENASNQKTPNSSTQVSGSSQANSDRSVFYNDSSETSEKTCGTKVLDNDHLIVYESDIDVELSDGSDLPEETSSVVKASTNEAGDEKGVLAKKDTVVGLTLTGGSGESHNVISSLRERDVCLCKAKWRLEEALQEALAYTRGETFRPFVYPEQHLCLL